VALRQRVQQRLCLLQVDGVKALGEPAVDRGEQVIGYRTLPLLLPEAGQTHRRPQLPGFGLFAGGGVAERLETDFWPPPLPPGALPAWSAEAATHPVADGARLRTSEPQTPPDFVVKYQAIDIVDVILRLI